MIVCYFTLEAVDNPCFFCKAQVVLLLYTSTFLAIWELIRQSRQNIARLQTLEQLNYVSIDYVQAVVPCPIGGRERSCSRLEIEPQVLWKFDSLEKVGVPTSRDSFLF